MARLQIAHSASRPHPFACEAVVPSQQVNNRTAVGQTTNLANGTNGGPKTGEKLRNAPKTRKWGWKTGKKCILGRFWAARGLRRGFMAGKQEIFMKTGGDGGLILFSCVFPVFLLSRGFWGSAGVWRAWRRPAEAKSAEKRLATGLGGLKTGVFSRKTGSLQENRNFSGKQEGGSLFLFGRLFSVSGFVVAGPGGAGAVSPMAGPTGASYKNPNPRQYPITNVQHPDRKSVV